MTDQQLLKKQEKEIKEVKRDLRFTQIIFKIVTVVYISVIRK